MNLFKKYPICELTSRTHMLLAKLEATPWFANVGGLVLGNVPRAASWREAVSICRQKRSENIVIESRNLLSEKLFIEHSEQYQRTWNSVCATIWSFWQPISDSRIQPIVIANKLSSRFVQNVNLAIVMACMESEYADLVPPRFFKDRLDWYLAGHFPCGWEGDFPEGQLVVF